jgi:hypothetical protein
MYMVKSFSEYCIVEVLVQIAIFSGPISLVFFSKKQKLKKKGKSGLSFIIFYHKSPIKY